MARKNFYIIPFYIVVIVTALSSIVNSFPKLFPAENPIFLQKDKGEYSLDRQISVLKDTTGKWDIEDVSSDNLSKIFVRVNKEAPNYGFTNAVFWVRFEVIDTFTNAKENSEKWLLVNKYPMLEDIRLYYQDDHTGKFIENKAGLTTLIKDKAIHNLAFVSQLPMQKNKLNTFYIRISTPSPVIVSFEIMTMQTFYNQRSVKLFFHGILFGILFLIIAYNSFLYFSVKEKTYLFYVLYVFSCASFLFIYEGYYTKFFGSIFDRDYYTLQMVAVSSLGPFWLLLTRDFLQTKKHFPSVYNLLNILVLVSAFIILFLFFLPLSVAVSIFTISDILFLVLSLVVSIIMIKKGFALSKFYLLALSGTLIGACILSARNFNILPDNFWTDNAFQLGILWEVIILSYSLGYRMSDLEKRVEERTSELIHRTEELKNLSSHLQTIREEERKYVAAEIHDEFGGALSILKMDLFKLEKQNTNQPGIFDSLLQRVDNTIKKIQQIATELRPEILDDLGLVDAIDWYCEEFQKKTQIACSVDLNVSDVNIDKNLSLDIFRTLQESLTNVFRHSKAKNVKVSFFVKNNTVNMSIVDDGIGITDEQIKDTKSIGLIGMRERLPKWNGVFNIFRNEKNGTTVYISLPLLNEDITGHEK